MRTIHVLPYGRQYCMDGYCWGDDAEGVMLYLSAKGVSPNEIAKALAGVALTGGYIIQHA